MRRIGTIFILCWVLLIGTGAFYSLKSVVTGEPVPGEEMTELDTQIASADRPIVQTSSLMALDDLRSEGLLTDEEYFRRRNSLMKGM